MTRQPKISDPARRLPAAERAEYVRLRREGLDRIIEGKRLLRAAGRLYRDTLLAQAGELFACGLGEDEVAARLGITPKALRRLLDRAARERHG